ncbi:monoheme cytochrome C [Sinomicrobium weinanense]|uniref:Monoheme cytochrome C n=1 Tax=Sinomicrobium weinanense TaxID=2842200 RepID=A0A926PZT8_9FLAO|nr:monoheme cytochrome C [Sinomicrobium weinanense]MBC9794422.1 monoheme cytochrome C [Sinomicrobium weinanense]MBU3124329.1 monoheme cytochrome C [Sinomicrobium weinanense]
MNKQDKFREEVKKVRRLVCIVFVSMMSVAGVLVYVMIDPELSFFRVFIPREKVYETNATVQEDDYDKIENGIHVRTGLVEAEGLMTVVNNCTNCHSAKLITQNRMTKERWVTTIRWMQETQNLWDLGANEDIIIDYLVQNYPPRKKGRRQGLGNINWYKLK